LKNIFSSILPVILRKFAAYGIMPFFVFSRITMKRIRDLYPEAFLFDLDGTLIDSEMPWARAIVSWLAANGISADEGEIVNLVFGHSWKDIHTAIITSFPSLPRHSAEEDGAALRAHYRRLVADPTSLVIPSAVAFYRAAAEIAPCAIVSGSPRRDVAAAAKLCGIDDVTRFVLGMEDYAHGKPAPDGYLLAAQRLGATPGRCLVVEDSTAGIRSGIAAGMQVLGVDRNPVVRQDFTDCTLKVADLAEFL